MRLARNQCEWDVLRFLHMYGQQRDFENVAQVMSLYNQSEHIHTHTPATYTNKPISIRKIQIVLIGYGLIVRVGELKTKW